MPARIPRRPSPNGIPAVPTHVPAWILRVLQRRGFLPTLHRRAAPRHTGGTPGHERAAELVHRLAHARLQSVRGHAQRPVAGHAGSRIPSRLSLARHSHGRPPATGVHATFPRDLHPIPAGASCSTQQPTSATMKRTPSPIAQGAQGGGNTPHIPLDPCRVAASTFNSRAWNLTWICPGHFAAKHLGGEQGSAPPVFHPRWGKAAQTRDFVTHGFWLELNSRARKLKQRCFLTMARRPLSSAAGSASPVGPLAAGYLPLLALK